MSARCLALTAFALGLIPGANAQFYPGFEPNYIGKLTPSREGVAAGLEAVWKGFPLRVEVVDSDPLFTDEYFQAFVRATQRWFRASNGMVSFQISRVRRPGRADVVVRFRSNRELNRYGGYTTFLPDNSVRLDLSATRTSGKATEVWLLERVATHELGHVLGIAGHSPDDHDVMSLCYETTEISRADINTLRWAYRALGFTQVPVP